MPDFPDTSGHLHSDNHVKTGIFPHNYPSRLRKYNILLHITYVRRSLNRSIVPSEYRSYHSLYKRSGEKLMSIP